MLDFGWPDTLAPPLERLCSICKSIESWLNTSAKNVVVLHCKTGLSRLAVVVAAYINYYVCTRYWLCHSYTTSSVVCLSVCSWTDRDSVRGTDSGVLDVLDGVEIAHGEELYLPRCKAKMDHSVRLRRVCSRLADVTLNFPSVKDPSLRCSLLSTFYDH